MEKETKDLLLSISPKDLQDFSIKQRWYNKNIENCIGDFMDHFRKIITGYIGSFNETDLIYYRYLYNAFWSILDLKIKNQNINLDLKSLKGRFGIVDSDFCGDKMYTIRYFDEN